jgi:hypothetical protein
VSFQKLFEYAKDAGKYPKLRIRCKADESGSQANGRFLREMEINWSCLKDALSATK